MYTVIARNECKPAPAKAGEAIQKKLDRRADHVGSRVTGVKMLEKRHNSAFEGLSL